MCTSLTYTQREGVGEGNGRREGRKGDMEAEYSKKQDKGRQRELLTKERLRRSDNMLKRSLMPRKKYYNGRQERGKEGQKHDSTLEKVKKKMRKRDRK